VREKNRRGRVAEATMRPTHVLDPVISNMSQDPATDWTKVPEAENTLPAHSQRKWGYLRGSTAELTMAA
jgi:hypothetical protein